MASSYTLSFIPLTTVVVPRRSTSSPSFSLIPPPSLLGNRRMVLLQIKSLAMGESEARKLKYPTTGTETHGYFSRSLVDNVCMLVACACHQNWVQAQLPSSFLRGNGVTLFKVREEIIKLLGKSDMCGWTAYLLLGVWSQKDSAGRQILEALVFDEDKAKQVAVSMNEDVDLSFKKQGQ
ncbi:hypothetical protein HID58_069992 [Brassica napus]|uniref:Uncharacterized protein n=1 Tax=Brassica napus TaxID=3708 RepID=A0ABQ7YXI0_BRANA|nr:hypothetical protein HID58_069992 [Brassica napus]